MTTKPATPLPWHIECANKPDGWIASNGADDNGDIICESPEIDYSDSFDKWPANRAYIVEACNAYPRLLAERAELIKALRDLLSDATAADMVYSEWSGSLIVARALLSRLESA